MNSTSTASQDRRGHTLLEMTVVVAVITTVAALCWPAIRGPLQKSRLREAGKQLRSELARARLKAIESGTAQWFQFQPGTRHHRIAATPAAGVPAPATEASTGTDDEELEELVLPDGIRFCDDEHSGLVGSALETEVVEDETAWSKPIVFYPNGRTVDARIRLMGQPDLWIEVSLRGLTGIATVGKVEHIEELP
jgi:type II secretory pathway pseudopilin PulG